MPCSTRFLEENDGTWPLLGVTCKAMASIEESMDRQSCMTRNSLRLKSGTFYAVTSE